MRIALVLGALALACAAAAPTAVAEDVEFNGGSISGLWEDDAHTQAGFANLHFEFDQCGTQPDELTCVWSIEVVLSTGTRDGCPAVVPAESVLWSSGEQSGNGSVDSGPQSTAPATCQSHQLTVSYEFHKTYGPWEEEEPPPPVRITGGGGSFPLLPIGLVAETEQRIVDASPAAQPEPMPTSSAKSAAHRRLRVSRNCRSLFDGSRRYAFKFRRLGCRKATRLARHRWSGSTPKGYRCAIRRGGKSGRCASRKNPKRFFAWHPPRRRAAKG